MNPMQEIHFHMVNGDLADAYVEQGTKTFVAHFQYIQNGGVRFDPSATLPQIAGVLSFEALVHAVNNVAVVLRTAIDRIDSINNEELVSRMAQTGVVSKMGLSAKVLVNGI